MPVIMKKAPSKTPKSAPKKVSGKASIYGKIRRENLRLLVFEFGSPVDLAIKLGIKLASLQNHLKKTPTTISTKRARAIEETLGKPHGWMDRKNYDLALTSDEWLLLDTFRNGSDRDRIILASLANTLGAMPQQ